MMMVSNERDKNIDIIKGILIVLMVYGHTFGFLRNWIYLFHMPAFFMISGLCWNNNHSMSLSNAREYVFNRARRLLAPYILGVMAVTILRNVFVELHFYTDNTAFLECSNNTMIAQKCFGQISIKQIMVNAYNALCFNYLPPQLAGPLWFLYALFFICIVHCYIVYFIRKIEKKPIKYFIWVIIFILLVVVSWRISDGFALWTVDIRHRRLPTAYLCFLIGVMFNIITKRIDLSRYFDDIKIGSIICGVSVVVLSLLNQYGIIELSQGVITNPLFLIVCLLFGWIFLRSVLVFVRVTYLELLLDYIGQHTISIVLLHLFAFKIVSYFFVLIKGLPLYYVASYPIIFNVNEAMKLLYTTIGILIPLLINYLYMYIKNSICNKTKSN